MTKELSMNANKKRLIIIDRIFSFITLLIYTIYVLFYVDPQKNAFVYLTFYIIGLISFLVLCFGKNFISVIKCVFIFILVFFSLAPMSQYTADVSLWGHMQFTDNDYLQANFYIIISILLILFFYFIKISNHSKQNTQKNVFECNNKAAVIFVLIDLLVLIYEFITGNIIGFENSATSSIGSSLSKIIRFIPVATLLFMIYTNIYLSKSVKKRYFYTNLVIVLILYFPFAGSVSRFMLFGTYIILLSEYVKKWRLKSVLPIMVIVGFVAIFPLFNFFKTNTIFDLDKFSFTNNSTLNTVDFDAYQLFMETIHYVSFKGTTYGGNILSSILFFVPRSIWSWKSLPTGEVIATFFGANFTNLSCPYIAEFYISFKVIGIIIGSILLGIIFNILDSWFSSINFAKKGIAAIILGMLIYLLRGSLLPTFSYSAALVISFIFVATILYFINYKTKNLEIRI